MNEACDYSSIGELLCGNRDANALVAIKDDVEILWSDFIRDVSAYTKKLKSHGAYKWALFCDDSYLFGVGFFALIQAGKSILLPAGSQEGQLLELSLEVDGYIADQKKDYLDIAFVELDHAKHALTTPNLLPIKEIHLELLTSGSTGKSRVVKKTLENLQQEILTLDKNWGAQLGSCIVFSTVSHQHIYGLLFRLLWPLCSGRAFYSKTFPYPELLMNKMSQYKSLMLVSSPAHLSKMPELVDLAQLKDSMKMIVSSAGPLEKRTADAINEKLGFYPVEVFGSTETGGVAFRTQESANTQWTPLRHVAIKTDGDDLLMVQSPYASIAHGDWFITGDKVSINDKGKFVHKGRGDRIVKIEEKKLSLVEMEERLNASEYIQDCAVFTLNSFITKRVQLAVVAILHEDAKKKLEEAGKREITKILKEYLSNYFEPILMPKKWRFVAAIPEDKQGKRPIGELSKLFDTNYDENIKVPEMISSSREQDKIHFSLRIPKDLYYFKGHFPEAPLLPGVVQIDWAMRMGHESFKIKSSFKALEVIKFKRIIKPGQLVDLKLRWESGENKLFFEYSNGDEVYSTGRIRMEN